MSNEKKPLFCIVDSVLYTMYMLDPTLQVEEQIITPGEGSHGKMRSGAPGVWGGPSKNATKNHLPNLDNSLENGSVNTIKKPETVPLADGVGGFKKKLEFYESPKELLTFEERSLVNPKDLANKLLTTVEYDEKFGADMVEFFLSKEKSKISLDTVYAKNGEVYEKSRTIPNSPPMFSEFGRIIGVSERTLKMWAKKYPKFQEAYEICQDVIQEFFVENGVKGDYASQFSIFAAKNLTKMKDVVVNKNENYDMKAVLDAIEKGTIPSE